MCKDAKGEAEGNFLSLSCSVEETLKKIKQEIIWEQEQYINVIYT